MRQKVVLILIIGLLAVSCSAAGNANAPSGKSGYEMISTADLQNLMDKEEITLVNVHIPLEGNITGTDAEIPFNEIENYVAQLPAEKDAKIVLYCRSGSMSAEAAETLVGLGYSNVFDLEGGYNAWVAKGLPFKE